MFGDSNQCSPVERGSQVAYNYTRPQAVHQMCPTTITLQYIERSPRYDKTTHLMLKKFLQSGKVKGSFKPVDKTLMKNICYLNKTRIQVNTRWCNQFTRDKDYIEVKFKLTMAIKRTE